MSWQRRISRTCSKARSDDTPLVGKMNSTTNGDFVMPVSYDKLWKMLIDKKMNRTDLKDAAGISFNVLAKMGRNEFVSMESLHKICHTLSCDKGEIMEFTDNDEHE